MVISQSFRFFLTSYNEPCRHCNAIEQKGTSINLKRSARIAMNIKLLLLFFWAFIIYNIIVAIISYFL